jgi:hypothetical protein
MANVTLITMMGITAMVEVVFVLVTILWSILEPSGDYVNNERSNENSRYG